jgi:hypothetical protein
MEKPIFVFVNRKKVNLESAELSGEALVRAAEFEGNQWDLLRLQGEGDPSGGEVVLFNQIITVKNGDHFRVIPGNRTFGDVTASATLVREHAAELERAIGLSVTVVEADNRFYIEVHDVPLPSGIYQPETTDVLMIADRQYPFSAMDMFWTNVDVLLTSGQIPRSAGCVQQHIGRSWRRFSWHRNSIWNSNGNPLLDHFAFVEQRFQQEG